MGEFRLLKLRTYLLDNLGLNFTENRNKELYTKMKDACIAFGFNDTNRFIDWLVNIDLDTNQTEKLASFLTIGETYFLREKKALDYLEYEYLPKLINERKGKSQCLKIWSAGCSSGEEPYSIAIMLKRLIPDLKDWNITIKATDINPDFLEKAQKGEYTEWSFRGISDSFKQRYFVESENDKYIIDTEIRDMVDFSFLNLISDDFNSSDNNIKYFDVILCRNVMIYFSDQGIQSVTSRFYESLAKGGVLILSPVESTHLVCSRFNKYVKDSVTIYMNESKDEIKNDTIKTPIHSYKYNKKTKYDPYALSGARSSFSSSIKEKKEIDENISNSIIKHINKKEITREYEYSYLLKLYKEGALNKVEEIISSVIDITSDSRIFLLLAKVKADKGQYLDSENFCLKAIDIDKVDAQAYYLLANIFYEQNREEEAIESLNKSVFLEPDFVLGYFLLGNIFRDIGKDEKSKKSFNNALKSLSKYSSNDIIEEYEDLTAQRLEEIIESYLT